MEDRFELFTTLMTKISRNIRRIKTKEMAEFDLKTPHTSCLYYLYKVGGMTAKELCDICDEDKAAISRSIDFLEKQEFIECDSKADKRYKSELYLTEKGKEVAQKVAKKVDYVVDKASEGLSEENRIILYKSLNLISENLKKFNDKY